MDRIIHISTELPVDPARAFAYFTDKGLLESWLTAEADVEPVEGGKYELFWTPEDREFDSTIGCRVTAVEPGSLLAFEWKGPKQYSAFMNECDPLTHVTVSFAPVGDGTKVHLVHSGWRSTPEWEEAREWFVRVWGGAFKQLSAVASPE
ncbi:MAG: SRPBCC domain-containing protein [Candidatus Zixiibacteriota bacterium]